MLLEDVELLLCKGFLKVLSFLMKVKKNLQLEKVLSKQHQLKGFDLNLTKYGEDFIAEVGSDKGRKLVDDNKSLFSQADESKVKRRSTARESFKNSLKSQVRERETPQRDAILGSVKKSGRCTEVCPGKIDIREVIKGTIKCK